MNPKQQDTLYRFLLTLLISLLVVPGAEKAFAASWQADFSIRIISPRTETIFLKGHFYQQGEKVRIETEGSDEVDLFDFKARIGMRVFPKDRIYFTSTLSLAKIIKAVKEGWIEAPPPYRESKTLLWKGEIKGRAARFYLMTLIRNNQSIYHLRWVTDDLLEMPLRIIYPGAANETVIIDYESTRTQTYADGHFEPPSNYLSLSPF